MTQSEKPDTVGRSDEILARITPVFARKGFDGASMQDLAGAAEMSVGNFYRYFPSKFALVEALIGRCMRDVHRDLDAVRHETDFLSAFRRLIEMNRDGMVEEEAAFWVHVDAAAVRYPEIRTMKDGMEAGIRAAVLMLLRREVPPLDVAMEKRLEELADFMVALVSGLFRRFASGDRVAERERFDRLTCLMVDTARDRLVAIRAAAPVREAAE